MGKKELLADRRLVFADGERELRVVVKVELEEIEEGINY